MKENFGGVWLLPSSQAIETRQKVAIWALSPGFLLKIIPMVVSTIMEMWQTAKLPVNVDLMSKRQTSLLNVQKKGNKQNERVLFKEKNDKQTIMPWDCCVPKTPSLSWVVLTVPLRHCSIFKPILCRDALGNRVCCPVSQKAVQQDDQADAIALSVPWVAWKWIDCIAEQ